jgi:hypothetical protein
MDRAYDLLKCLLEQEAAALNHAAICKECNGIPRCPTGKHLMTEHIMTNLRALEFVRQTERERLKATFAQVI